MLLQHPSELDTASLAEDCVVVVGSGAVGLHLAVQLAKMERQVVVLESGDQDLSSFSGDAYQNVGRPHEGIAIGRSVSLGGTTNLWGGQLVEFMPIDLDGRDWLPGSRWPLRFEELAPYYEPTYKALGIDLELLNDDAVWRGIGRKPPELTRNVEIFLTRWLKVPNVASHYEDEVATNPNLLVVLNATATGFVGGPERITAIRYSDGRGGQGEVPGGAFVLGAGTIENARLLLHAAADSTWECPWRGNDNVGRYFHDHLGGRLAYIRPRDPRAFFDLFCNIVYRNSKFQPKLRLDNETLTHEELLNCQAMIAFESSIRENLVFLKQFVRAAIYRRQFGSAGKFLRSVVACARHMIPLMWKYVVEHRILIPSGSRITLFLQAEVEPQRESRITIDPGVRDRFGLPKVVLDWRIGEREFADIVAFTQRVRAALEDADLAELDVDPQLAEEKPEYLATLRDTNHQSGGCMMGESPADGVVDRDLRVFGTKNLFVVGACVYRTCSNANSTFTAMTLATRLAEHLTRCSDANN